MLHVFNDIRIKVSSIEFICTMKNALQIGYFQVCIIEDQVNLMNFFLASSGKLLMSPRSFLMASPTMISIFI